jgi:hypothetical protein
VEFLGAQRILVTNPYLPSVAVSVRCLPFLKSVSAFLQWLAEFLLHTSIGRRHAYIIRPPRNYNLARCGTLLPHIEVTTSSPPRNAALERLEIARHATARMASRCATNSPSERIPTSLFGNIHKRTVNCSQGILWSERLGAFPLMAIRSRTDQSIPWPAIDGLPATHLIGKVESSTAVKGHLQTGRTPYLRDA